MLLGFARLDGLDPFIQAVTGYPQAFGYLGHRIAPFDDLTNGLIFKFW
jgi:hypothetical protein